MILAELLTVALLTLVLVMVWQCWNLPPVAGDSLVGDWVCGYDGGGDCGDVARRTLENQVL